MASYVAGTRRLEEILTEARRLAYQENYSYTEGWDDNTLVEISNLAMDRLYGAITEINNPANIQQTEINRTGHRLLFFVYCFLLTVFWHCQQ